MTISELDEILFAIEGILDFDIVLTNEMDQECLTVWIYPFLRESVDMKSSLKGHIKACTKDCCFDSKAVEIRQTGETRIYNGMHKEKYSIEEKSK